MKIKDVRCELYLRERPEPTRTTRGGYRPAVGKMPLTMIRIITDDGIEGFGSAGKEINENTVSILKSELIGRDPFDREWIWQRLWYLLGTMTPDLETLAAIDIALWDLAGKALGLPVYKLLGAYRDKIRVYASSLRYPTIKEYVDDVLSCKQQGITAYKIHSYWGIGERDIELCRAVREAAGNDMILVHDPIGRYNREEALLIGRELEKLNFYWFEEPVPDYDIEGLVMLKEKLNIPIAATETIPMGIFNIPEYLLRRACNIVRCDTRFHGGITPCKKIAGMCEAFGMKCELHTFVQSVVGSPNLDGGIPNLHLQCAIKNCEFYEVAWPRENIGLKEQPKLDSEGYLHVPQKPGLGIDIDWEALGKPVATF